VSADSGREYLFWQSVTHVHVGKKAVSIMAPDAQRAFPLKSASVMDVSIVTGLEALTSPLNVNVVNDLKSDGKHREGRFCQTNAEQLISGVTYNYKSHCTQTNV
jgi:hypothetical protein